MAISTGTVVTQGDQKYVIGAEIRTGGFGTTYHAKRIAPSELNVVVKVPGAHVMADPVWLAKFEREARILGNISHENVVKSIAYWPFPDGTKALVQELVTDGKHLSEYIKDHPDAAASVFLQVLYALRSFHDHTTPSAVHRDISPANILVSNDGVAKVIDFGLAKEDPRATAVLTQTGDQFGTHGCMSPEQLSDPASVDHRTDLFALGRAVAAAIQQRRPGAARVEKLPEPWRTICTSLTEDDPKDRPPSAAEAMCDAMELFARKGLPIENFERHVWEMRATPPPRPQAWAALCQSHFFALEDYDRPEIELLSLLHPEAFGSPFDANAFLDLLEESEGIKNTQTGFCAFSDADPIGTLYKSIYAALDPPHRLVCFRRLCRVAVKFHRFYVMGAVRTTYAAEPDPQMQTLLRAILDEEDPPPHTIYGRDAIPERDP